ncbi:MAG TPA: TraB/GumN family protein [Sphingomonas sp.]|nr:TraB/GumN family protein [Sphingomonas sp.]
MAHLRFLAPFLLLAAAPGAPVEKPLPAVAHPALWKLADADTIIWLFGSIHILPAATRWIDPAIQHAIDNSQSLTIEVVLDQDPGQVAEVLMSRGRASGLPPLARRVPPAKRARLAAMIKASGIPPAMFDGMKSWAAAVMLTGAALQEIGIETAASPGVEPQLTALFRSAGKPVDGLETAAAQLGFFDRLPESAQRAFLVALLENPAKSRSDFREMIAAWSRGDPAAIEKSFADDPEFTPALRDLLIRQRDKNWADALAKRLDQPGAVFVAVGAGHLVGPDSVQKMLAARGLKVVRVQ